jgi:DNA-binding MarR family transcriptional regulator
VDQNPSLQAQIEQATESLPQEAGIVVRPDGLKYLSPIRAQAFLGLVRAGHLLADQLTAELEAEHGISLRAFEVLLFLAVFAPGGRLRMTELTEQAPLSQSRVSRLVADLEKRGLVTRSPAETDGRGIAVSITTKGIAKFKKAQETHLVGLEDRLFSHLTAADIRRLAAITTKVIDASKPATQ